MAEPKIRARVRGTAATSLQEATTVKKEKAKVGRAAKSADEEVLKLKAFNLPLPLIQEIVDYANVKYNGNASKLAVDVFRNFLEKQKR
jgi:hypothetical protein